MKIQLTYDVDEVAARRAWQRDQDMREVDETPLPTVEAFLAVIAQDLDSTDVWDHLVGLPRIEVLP